MSVPVQAVERLFSDVWPRVEPVEGANEIVQLVTHDSVMTYIMQCVEAGQRSLVESGIGTGRALREFTDIGRPSIPEAANSAENANS